MISIDKEHQQSYIICATPRSGTTLLCDLLTDTGIAGRPDSFFRCQSIRWWADYLGISTTGWINQYEFDSSYLGAVHQQGTAGTAIFGMRLMWENVNYLSTRLDSIYPGLANDNARLQAAFGSIRFIHLSREDKLEQAISRIKAEQTGLWHAHADGTERERLIAGSAAHYDAQVIAQQVEEYRKQDAAWLNWFAEQEIQPVCISYEALANSPQAALAKLLSALKLDPARAEAIRPRTMKLADSESRQWANRLRTEKNNDESQA